MSEDIEDSYISKKEVLLYLRDIERELDGTKRDNKLLESKLNALKLNALKLESVLKDKYFIFCFSFHNPQ